MLINPMFSIIVLNYNGEKWLPKCLHSIKEQDFRNFEVIFVDNGSRSNDANYARVLNMKVNYCTLSSNVGFCVGNNLGSQFALGEWLIFLSNDTWIESDFLSKIFNASRQHNAEILVPKVLEYEKNENDSGQIGYIQDLLGYGISDENREPFWCLGCCFVIKKNVWDKCGGFDKDFWSFGEDLDLSWRAQLLGFNTCAVSDARIHHYGGGTFGKAQLINSKQITNPTRRYFGERNRITSLLKNYSTLSILIIIPLLFIQTLIAFFVLLLAGESTLAQTYASAWIWNLKNIKKTLTKRKLIQTQRIRSDYYIIRSNYVGFVELKRFISYGIPRSK